MKEYNNKEQYYIQNTVWQRKLKLEKIPKFKTNYSDYIIFHFDLQYSLSKIKSRSKSLVISAINICLRYYRLIKQIYPYNKVGIIIYLKNTDIVNIDTFRAITDFIPYFAVINTIEDISYFDTNQYKHIMYGNCNGIKKILLNSKIQTWSVISGNLIVKELN